MSATIKGGTFGKEKRGTFPSTPPTKKSLKPSSSSPSSSSSTIEKPVPNYLKPTISSNLDFSRLPKKSTSDTSVQKPVLNRMRSFDRPPPVSSQVQKPLRNVSGGTEIKHVRSSSLHNPGPASERVYARSGTSLRVSKVEPTFSSSPSLRKSSLSSGPKKVAKKVTIESSFDHFPSSNQLYVEDAFVGVDSEIQSLPKISEMPDSNQELGDPVVQDIETKLMKNESSQNRDEGQSSKNVDQGMTQYLMSKSTTLAHKLDEKVEKTVDTKPEPKIVTISDRPKANLTDEVAGETDESNATVVKNVESLDEKKNEELTSKQEIGNSREESKAMDENPSVSSPSEASTTHSSSQNSSNKSLTISGAAPVKAQKPKAKKEKQEYNSVIEETATKLRGKKNKVLALAGAFETVISLEGANKK